MAVLNFIINEIFGQGAIFLALVAMIGLILQKKSASEVIRGTLMTAIGFFVLNAGTGLITGKSIDGISAACNAILRKFTQNAENAQLARCKTCVIVMFPHPAQADLRASACVT